MRPFSGRLALVTGSTSGIGLAIARALAAEGADIVLNGFGDPAAIEALREDLANEASVRVRYVGADLARPSEIEDMMREIEGELGGIDILVNNAGIQHVAPVHEFPPERWDAVLAVNLSACFHTIRLALPSMLRRNFGRIVNIASVHGLVASVHKAAYVAAKHGLVGLTKVVALETAGTGVTCNAICPGWVRTPLVERQIEARAVREGVDGETAARALLAEKQPSQRFVEPEHIAALAVFLCSPAAAEIRGATLTIDGGWTAQ
ncbi:D-beta-hydroxybutyrate dehydrogenase [bacterium HR40]|nr:D-beta-hydroxybutyrate dehydrogenase [bacterium HR40]